MGKILAVALAVLFAVIAPLVWLRMRRFTSRSQPTNWTTFWRRSRSTPSALGQVLVAATFPDQIDEAAASCATIRMPTCGRPAVGRSVKPWRTTRRLGHDGPTTRLDDRIGTGVRQSVHRVMTSIQRLRGRQRRRQSRLHFGTPGRRLRWQIEVWPAQPTNSTCAIRPAVVFFYHRAPCSLARLLHRRVAQP